MDSILIGQKLEALRHCISRIVEKCPDNTSLLAEDADLQDIVVLNLTRCVQLCVDNREPPHRSVPGSSAGNHGRGADHTGTHGCHR
jgi:hypothetical protein